MKRKIKSSFCPWRSQSYLLQKWLSGGSCWCVSELLKEMWNYLEGGCLFFLSAATFGTCCCLQSLIYTLTLWSSGLWRRMQCVHGLQEVRILTSRFNLTAAPKYKQSVLLKCIMHCCCCLIFGRFQHMPNFSTEHREKQTTASKTVWNLWKQYIYTNSENTILLIFFRRSNVFWQT